jgi:hypothetical protein
VQSEPTRSSSTSDLILDPGKPAALLGVPADAGATAWFYLATDESEGGMNL